MDKADNLMTSSANYAGASWMSSDSGTITGVTLGVTSRGEWTATLNNPGNAWRWEVIVAVMKVSYEHSMIILMIYSIADDVVII